MLTTQQSLPCLVLCVSFEVRNLQWCVSGSHHSSCTLRLGGIFITTCADKKKLCTDNYSWGLIIWLWYNRYVWCMRDTITCILLPLLLLLLLLPPPPPLLLPVFIIIQDNMNSSVVVVVVVVVICLSYVPLCWYYVLYYHHCHHHCGSSPLLSVMSVIKQLLPYQRIAAWIASSLSVEGLGKAAPVWLDLSSNSSGPVRGMHNVATAWYCSHSSG